MKLVHQRVKAGKTQTVTPLEHLELLEEGSPGGAQIIDLTELLKRSLKKPGSKATAGEDDAAVVKGETPAKKKPAAGAASEKNSKPSAKTATANARVAAAQKTAAPRRKAA